MSVVLAGLPGALATAVAVMIGLLFLMAALAKLRDRSGFQAVLAGYRLVPQGALGVVATLLPLAELAVAAALLAGMRPALAGAAALLLLFAGAVAINLRRGRTRIDCGCGGADGRRPISAGLVGQDLILAALALAALAVPTTPGGALWLGSAAVGLLFFVLSLTFDRIVAVGALYPGGRRAPVAWTQS